MCGIHLHRDVITPSDIDIYNMQETDIPNADCYAEYDAHRNAGRKLAFGKSTQLAKDGSSFGRRVAISSRTAEMYDLKIDGDDLHVLELSGRWIEKLIPVGNGDRFVINAIFCGIAGASSDSEKARENERLLATALSRMLQFKDTPYFLAMDGNISPSCSKTISAATNEGLVHDLPRDWAQDADNVQCTFFRDKIIEQDKTGKGITRIDTILANHPASQLVEDVNYGWTQSKGFDHLMIIALIDLDVINMKSLQLKKNKTCRS